MRSHFPVREATKGWLRVCSWHTISCESCKRLIRDEESDSKLQVSFMSDIEGNLASYCWDKIIKSTWFLKDGDVAKLKQNFPVNVILGQKYLPPYRLQYTLKHVQGLLGYFSARSRQNDGVSCAMAIMMRSCGWDGQKQATNFGQTPGQRQTRHTQSKKMLDIKYASLLPSKFTSTEAVKGERLYL